MTEHQLYDVIIVGGSFAGLSAAMALGRACREVLIIDSGNPCNRQSPFAHNLLTHDGEVPGTIAAKAKEQVLQYPAVHFLDGRAVSGKKEDGVFVIRTNTEAIFSAKKLLFTTGVTDIMPDIDGFADCWGISILHCPYCHGYEVIGQKTALLGNGAMAFEFCRLLLNWNKSLTILTNGPCTLTEEELQQLKRFDVEIIENELSGFRHREGKIQAILFKDRAAVSMEAIYTKPAFKQHSSIPEQLNCTLTEGHGFIQVDELQRTNIPGIFAAGDNTTFFRAISGAIAAGGKAGACINAELAEEDFNAK
jgi:thioredoxin reductase